MDIRGIVEEQKISQWVLDVGGIITKLDDDKADYHFKASPPSKNFTFEVIKPKTKSILAIGMGINITPEHQQKFNASTSSEQQTFMWDLRFNLLQIGVEFAFRPNIQNPSSVEITELLWNEELTKQDFFDAINKVKNAYFMVAWKYQARFGEGLGTADRGQSFIT